MNLAILVGISKYDNQNPLPACEYDMKLIEKILQVTRKYEKILTISSDTSSAQLKTKISSFIKESQNSTPDEVFFYYSGHGDYDGSDFYFTPSDYDRNKKNQTSLSNSEVDTWLRSLKAALTIKVIDACHSSVQYLKDANNLDSYFKATTSPFNRCYFMFSSRQDQYSYQDDKLSEFTQRFAEAIISHQSPSIRYKDIVDYIADAFINNRQQKPNFAMQCDSTELFCDLSDEIRSLNIFDSIPSNKSHIADKMELHESSSPTITESPSLKQIIERDAANYISKEEAINIFTYVREAITSFAFDSELVSLFDLSQTFESGNTSIPKLSAIGKWLSENPNQFFAKPVYGTEEYEEEVTDPNSVYTFLNSLERPKVRVRKSRIAVTSYQSTADMPYDSITLTAEPRFPNLNRYQCSLVYLVSDVHTIFFYYYSLFHKTGWESRKLNMDFKWTYTPHLVLYDKDTLLDKLRKILAGFSTYVLEDLEKNFLEDNSSS